MSRSNELYQQVILDHNKNPRNYREIPGAALVCEGHNPLCGDHITIYVNVDAAGTLADLSFQGNGCAISKASASMMTAYLKGKSQDEVKTIFTEFHDMVRGEFDPKSRENHLGKLTLFEGVREYSSRIKCASLAWHALMGALEKKQSATTEA
ncbi:MAG TPA: SUF system NifU family Fe-S cluster assembly protein [Fibrobacteria bacterium]|nr:SUF system NifU family Fe-S cluster assembly protein [Fibrobacteria bacterium]